MKNTTKSAEGTSFYGDAFRASVSDLRKILGLPKFENNNGEEKTNFEWIMETESGEVIAIYDWKEYRALDEDELIDWHIGGENEMVTDRALNEIAGELNELG